MQGLGSRFLLCVTLEEGVTVQDMVDFMSLCERINQPWTFYFSTY
jgi:hypothetical protein